MIPSSRPDARFLGSAPDVAADASQHAQDLVAQAPGGYEPASSRTALDGLDGRALELRAELEDASEGVLLDHGGAQAFQIRKAAGVVEFRVGGQLIASVTPPNLSPAPSAYLIGWSTEALDGDGLFDVRSEITIVDEAGGVALARVDVDHASAPASSGDTFAVAGVGAAMSDAYALGVAAARVSSRFHSRVELREHWLAQSPAPTLEGITAVEGPLLPRGVASAGGLVGPAYHAASVSLAVGRARHRQTSPLVQCLVKAPPVWSSILTKDTAPSRVATVDGFQTHLGWVWRRRPLAVCGWALVRVQWAAWTVGESMGSVTLRAYSADAPPGSPSQRSSQSITRATDDGPDGLGVLEAFAPVRIVRDEEGASWLWLASRIDGPGAGDTHFVIRSVTITPMSKAPAEAQIPDQWS